MIAVTATSANRARFQLAPIALTGITVTVLECTP
jgi:hypothetical protein